MKCSQINLKMFNFLEKIKKDGQSRVEILLSRGVEADKVGKSTMGQLALAKVVEAVDHGYGEILNGSNHIPVCYERP